MLAVSIRSDDSFFWIVENKVLIFIEPKSVISVTTGTEVK